MVISHNNTTDTSLHFQFGLQFYPDREASHSLVINISGTSPMLLKVSKIYQVYLVPFFPAALNFTMY